MARATASASGAPARAEPDGPCFGAAPDASGPRRAGRRPLPAAAPPGYSVNAKSLTTIAGARQPVSERPP